MQQLRPLIIAALFVLCTAGVLAFSLRSLQATLSAFRGERDVVEGLQERARRADALEARWDTVESEAKKINRAILRREDLPSFFATIEATAAQARVTETTTVRKAETKEMSFLLQATGDFAGLYEFVTHLNVLPTLLFLEEVTFTSGGAVEMRRASPTNPEGKPAASVVIRVPFRGVAEEEEKAPESTPPPAGEEGEL